MRASTVIVASCLFGGIAVPAPLSAQVTGVVTEASATLQFRPNVNGDPDIRQYTGHKIGEQSGDLGFGSGASFASTANVGVGVVEFQNGNAAGGAYTYATSRTVIDVSFTNDGSIAVRPELHSTITPAGLGLYVGAGCLQDLNSCGPGFSFPGDFRMFQDFSVDGRDPVGDVLAGASFSFRITGGGSTIYKLTGSVALVHDAASGTNILVSDLDAAALALSGFQMTSTPGSDNSFGFAWDTTDILVAFPDSVLLQPGQSSTFTYETEVASFSRSQCYEQLTAACIIAYSSFGDPIGRGGGTNPALLRGFGTLDAATDGSLAFDSFTFQLPSFKNGVLSYQLATGVPEPATWAMLIAGFGLVGAMRRRRAALAT
nr:PEPxxWA-CTERM sorting domain-containing protein [Sphingomonas flavalba]